MNIRNERSRAAGGGATGIRPKRTALLLLLAVALAAGQWIALSPANGQATTELTVYDDKLSDQFVDYGWAIADLAAAGTVRSGSRAIRLEPDEGRALYFYKDRIMSLSDYGTLRFWVHGGAVGGQRVKPVLSLGGQTVVEKQLSELIPGGIAAGEWREVRLPLAEAGALGLLDGFWLWGEGEQEAIYIDDIAFLPEGAGTGTGTNGGGTGEETGGEEPGGEEPDHGAIVGLTFEQPQLIVREGGLLSAPLVAQYEDGALARFGENAGISWTVEDATVAEAVNGLIRGLRVGSTSIAARLGHLEATVRLDVLERAATNPIEPLDGLYIYDDAARAEAEPRNQRVSPSMILCLSNWETGTSSPSMSFNRLLTAWAPIFSELKPIVVSFGVMYFRISILSKPATPRSWGT